MSSLFDLQDAKDPLAWRQLIEQICATARAYGHIITVETVPGYPPAMGNYTQRVDVRPVIDHKAEAAKRSGYDVPTFRDAALELITMRKTERLSQSDIEQACPQHGLSTFGNLVVEENAHLRRPILADLQAIVNNKE